MFGRALNLRLNLIRLPKYSFSTPFRNSSLPQSRIQSSHFTRTFATIPPFKNERTYSIPKGAVYKKPNKLLIALGAVTGVGVWVLGVSYMSNQQRSKNAIMESILFSIRTSPQLIDYLGEHIDLLPPWKWIYGTINQVQGHVDVRFEVTGSKGNTAEIHVVMRKHPPPEHQLWETVKYQVLLKDSQQKVLSTYNGFMEENTGRLQLVPKE